MDENYNDWKYKIINKRMQLKNAIHHEKLIKLIKKNKEIYSDSNNKIERVCW